LPRFGARKGTGNENFLNADAFGSRFLDPCEATTNSSGFAQRTWGGSRRIRGFAAFRCRCRRRR